MKKRILSFVLLMLMVLTSFASAAEISYVASEGDISFTSVTFANDGTNVTASLKGIKAQGTDDVTLMMTMYNGKDKLIDAKSTTVTVGTEEKELKASLPVPSGDYKLAASLFNAENGLAPIAAPAYSDYKGATDLIDLKVEGVTLEGFKSDVYDYSYVTEGLTTYPEISASVAEGSTKVSVEYEDTFPGVATITVANGLGTVSSVYKIDFTPLRHIVVGATSEANFVEDSGTNLNLVSRTAVSEGVGSKNIYTNLTGAPDDSLDFGSKWTTDYMPLGSHHAIRSVDSMLQGWDYFICANGSMKKDAGDYFKFQVNHNARIVVVTLAAEPSLEASGFEKMPSKTYAKASYVSGGATEDVRKDLNALGITPTYADMSFYNANKADHAALVSYFAEKYNLNPDVAAESIPINRAVGISEFTYANAYSKFYEAYEDEPAKVIIPAPEANQGRGYIVAVIPVGEDGELPGGGNQGGGSEGGDTPDTPVVPDTPTGPLGELKSLVGGMTYSQYIDYVNSVVPAGSAMTKETTVSETQKISTLHNVLSTISEEGKACSISAWRVFRNVADGWDGLTFMTTDPSHYQTGSAKGWPMTMFSGKATEYEGDSCQGTGNQIVPWWTIPVNKDMNVSIVTNKELTHLSTKGWTKLTIGTDIEDPFKIYDSRNNTSVGTNKYVYTKAFKAGDTVELYNENTGLIDYVPYIAVFDTPDAEGGDGGEGGEDPEPDTPELAEGNHVIVGARYASEIVADDGVTNGFKSAAAVTSAKHSKTNGVVYTNLHGNEDESQAVYGSRWADNFKANSVSYHEIYQVDNSLKGLDYFAFDAGSDAYTGTLLTFDVTSDVEVSIIATNTGMAFVGYQMTENSNGWVRGRFINRNMADAMNAIGVKPLYSVVGTYNPANKDTFYNTYLKAAYDAADATAKQKFDEQWTLFGTASAFGNNSNYKAKYTATYTLPEGQETMTITVPGNTTSATSRDIIVVVKPVAEDLSQDAEVLSVIAKIDAIGTVTLDSEAAIAEARAAYDALSDEKQTYVTNIGVLEEAEITLEELKAAASQPDFAEGDHVIVGARYTDEIVADAGVTNGFKSAAAVTSAKSGRTDGIVYTNLRGNPDEAGTVYGARLCTMPANSTSYHEIDYVDESLEGSDYFVFTAGGNAHSDATLLKFEIAADAEVSILATHSAMAFNGFTLSQNSNGWVKGRFINRNMADAMNAIGVTPVYSVVKTYKPAEKETFYNTYLKAAYDAAGATAKAKFDEQWSLFGTVAAIGNDSAYKAMYKATFRIPEGEDTMEVIVPGNTSSNSSRNLIIVVKSAAPEAEEPDLSEDAEVLNVIAKIDAIGTVTLDSEAAILEARAAYTALSDEKQAYVTNLSVLEAAEAALEELKAAPVETVGTLISKVSGLTYAKYLDYIESVTGTMPVSTSVIKETDVIATSSIVIRDSFAVGNQIGSESARRRLESIHEDYAFLNGVKFFSPTIEWSQQADVRKWFTKIFWGQDATYSYNGFDYTVNAATDALPTVAWWTVPVTQATVYIASYVEMPHLEDAGWTKADTTNPVFTWKDTNNGAVSNGPAMVYTKEVTDTETIELPNSNTGEHGTYPYFVFFVPSN